MGITVSLMGRTIDIGTGEYWTVKSLEDCKAHRATHDYCDVCFDQGITTPAYAVIGAKMVTVLCESCLDGLRVIVNTHS